MRRLVSVLAICLAPPTAVYAGDVSLTLPIAGEVGVRVEKPAGDGVHFAEGSGVYLGGGLVLTAAHVVKLDPEHTAVTVLVDGVRTDGNVVFDGRTRGVDLALIKIVPAELSPKRRDQTPVPICLANPGPSQPVVVASLSTVTTALTISTTITSDKKQTASWTNLLTTGYHAGNSGGGVFNPRQGCLWGIINLEMSGHLPDTGRFVDLTAFVPASKIEPFIGAYLEQEAK